jgi:hypothetical protein
MTHITLTQMPGRVCAEIDGHPYLAAFGESAREALGDLLYSFPVSLGCVITDRPAPLDGLAAEGGRRRHEPSKQEAKRCP